MGKSVSPSRVRYIKLGQAGRWEASCIANGLNRIGFGTAQPARFALCLSRRWDDLRAAFVLDDGTDAGTATRFVNAVRTFFEDDGSILWITFHGERLYWGQMDSAEPRPSVDLDGITRGIAGGWRSTDLNNQPLTKDRLSGALVQLTAYRGTSCDVRVADYVIRRVNGERLPEVESAVAAARELQQSAIGLFRLLTPDDFELLVDLVFSTSGWRRVGVVGKTQKTLDMDLVLPTTGDRAFVQVKSRTTSDELAEYIAGLDDRADDYQRMFYVYHSGDAALPQGETRVTLVGPEKLAGMVLDAGLIQWLIDKTS